MSKKIQLNILGLSYSQTEAGAYALILSEENGHRRIPIIIGGSEAQAIAIQLENMIPARPLAYDLLLNLANSFYISLVEVYIHKLEEGIFYSELVFDNGIDTVHIDSRTSDAIALALRFHSPIYTNEEVLKSGGITFDHDDTDEDPKETEESSSPSESKEVSITEMTDQELEDKLLEAISNEQYEKASEIRDELKNRMK